MINCHIRNKRTLNNFLEVVSALKLDICGVAETWFGGDGKEKMKEALRETNFMWIGCDRKGRKGGGVGFLVRKEVKIRVPRTSRAEGLMWIEVGDEEGGKIIWQLCM